MLIGRYIEKMNKPFEKAEEVENATLGITMQEYGFELKSEDI